MFINSQTPLVIVTDLTEIQLAGNAKYNNFE